MKIPSRLVYPALFAIGGLLGAGIIVAVLMSQRVPQTFPQVMSPQLTAPTSSVMPSFPAESVTSTDEEKPYSEYVYATSTQRQDDRTVRLDVSWLPERVQLSDTEILHALRGIGMPERELTAYVIGQGDTQPYESSFAALWRVGTVASGEFAGSDLAILDISEWGMGATVDHFRLVIPQDGSVPRVIGGIPGADTRPNIFVDRMILMPNMSYTGPFPGDRLTLPSGKTIDRTESMFFENNPFFVPTSTAATSKLYMTSREGVALYRSTGDVTVFAMAPDGEYFAYVSRIEHTTDESQYPSFVPRVTWKDGSVNKEAYVSAMQSSGCGTSPIPHIVGASKNSQDPPFDPSKLVAAGTLPSGESVFVPKDPQTDPWVQAAYDIWFFNGEVKPSLAEFLKTFPRPLFFWKDAFGQWQEHLNGALIPPAECGKPVIYLYPEQTTNVSVKLPSFINVTKSEPTYPKQGWNVTAQPNGDLTMADGSVFGSLYWEGTGVGYQTPRDGFVVKDGDVETFLKTTLARYGLNEKESQEFRDFWVPKMVGAPYYRVSFLTSDWSKAAPLFVSPRPQSVIRIFMDWQKLNAPISIEAPKIVTPKRDGFTLVEWGGLLWN